MNLDSLKLQQTAKARIALLRKQAWDSLYVFTKLVCGRDQMCDQPHKEICEVITHGLDAATQLRLNFKAPVTTEFVKNNEAKLKKLIQVPRGAFKSTIATNGAPLWFLWHNQDLRILIDSETLGNAKLYLAGIKDMIENNEMLKLICVNDNGEYLLEPNYGISGGWTEEQVILKHRSRLGLKEPSLFCAGVDNARTGMHPDIIIMDDLVSERNVGTDVQIGKVKEHYRFSLSLLEPGGLQLVIGTRYHMADLYGDLLEIDTFEKYVRPAILPDGSLYFPTRLTEEFLAGQRKEQGSYIFSSQYMLNPIDDSAAMFKRAYIQYYDELPEIVETYILIDLAISKEERADYTVVMAVGLDKDKNIYIIEYVRAKMEPNQTIDTIFNMFERHRATRNVKAVGIEAVSFQKAMVYFIKDEMKRRGVYIPLKELKADSDKKRRIGALQPLFEAGQVFMRKEHKELEMELLEFPLSKHDDCADALAYILQLLRPGMAFGMKKKKSKYKITNTTTGY